MKTSEMITELEKNPKLIFPNGDFCLFRQGDKILLQDKDRTGVPMILFDMTTDWQPVREPVPWYEALQAWVDGKKIACQLSEKDRRVHDPKMCGSMSYEYMKTAINNGTWYIEDSSNG